MDLGGHAGTCPPMEPNSFIFAYIFTEKCQCWRPNPPPKWVHAPPLWKILDPALFIDIFFQYLYVELMKIKMTKTTLNVIQQVFQKSKVQPKAF